MAPAAGRPWPAAYGPGPDFLLQANRLIQARRASPKRGRQWLALGLRRAVSLAAGSPDQGGSGFKEAQKSFTRQSGVFILGQTASLGRTMLGPEIGYRIARACGAAVEPFVGIKGIFDSASVMPLHPMAQSASLPAGDCVPRRHRHGRLPKHSKSSRCARRSIARRRPACRSERPLCCRCQACSGRQNRLAQRPQSPRFVRNAHAHRPPLGSARSARLLSLRYIIRQLALQAILFPWNGRSAGYPWQAQPCAERGHAPPCARERSPSKPAARGNTFFTQRPTSADPCGGGRFTQLRARAGRRGGGNSQTILCAP
jgi:hypothetical protein